MDLQSPFRRDPERRLIAGICGALAPRIGVEPTWVRLAVALFAVFTGGFVIWAYAVLWLITPLGPEGRAPLTRWMEKAGRLFRNPPFEYPQGPDRL